MTSKAAARCDDGCDFRRCLGFGSRLRGRFDRGQSPLWIDRQCDGEHDGVAQRVAVLGAALHLSCGWACVIRAGAHYDPGVPDAVHLSNHTFDAARCSGVEWLSAETSPHAGFQLGRVDAGAGVLETHPVEAHGLSRAGGQRPQDNQNDERDNADSEHERWATAR